MALITLRDICMSFGAEPLLDRANLTVASGERIGLLGRNGVGKTTLMNIIGGSLSPDRGEVMRSQGVTVSSLAQGVPADLHGTVFDVICQGMGPRGRRLAAYRRMCDLNESVDSRPEDASKKQMALQQTIDSEDGWQIRQQVAHIISQMNLAVEGDVSTFSAGMKRQVLLAAALVARPDILLLDEPTNHLDMTAIDWLESFLL